MTIIIIITVDNQLLKQVDHNQSIIMIKITISNIGTVASLFIFILFYVFPHIHCDFPFFYLPFSLFPFVCGEKTEKKYQWDKARRQMYGVKNSSG